MTGGEELVAFGAAKVEIGAKLGATGGEELVAFVAVKVNIDDELGMTRGTEIIGMTDRLIEGSLVLDGV